MPGRPFRKRTPTSASQWLTRLINRHLARIVNRSHPSTAAATTLKQRPTATSKVTGEAAGHQQDGHHPGGHPRFDRAPGGHLLIAGERGGRPGRRHDEIVPCCPAPDGVARRVVSERARWPRDVQMWRDVMKLKVVPRGGAIEKIALRLRQESNRGEEQRMATKQKPSAGESRGHGRTRDSGKEPSKRDEGQSRSHDAENDKGEASRGARAQSDDKRESSAERDRNQGHAQAQAERREHSQGASEREQEGKDRPSGQNQRNQSEGARNGGRSEAELDLGQMLEDQVAQAVHPILEQVQRQVTGAVLQQMEQVLQPVRQQLEKQVDQALEPIREQLRQQVVLALEPVRQDLFKQVDQSLDPMRKQLKQQIDEGLEPVRQELRQQVEAAVKSSLQ